MPDWSIKFIPAKNPKPNQTADFVLSAPGNPTGPFSEHQAGAQHPPGQRPRPGNLTRALAGEPVGTLIHA